MVVANGLFAEQSTVRTPPSNVLEHCISNGRTKGKKIQVERYDVVCEVLEVLSL